MKQRLPSALLTARAFTVSSLMRTNVTSSGPAGTVRLVVTSALLDSLTTANPVSAPGLIRSPSAKLKVRIEFLKCKKYA